MKENLETNLDQINLQVKTERPRNAVECSLSSPTHSTSYLCHERGELLLGGGSGVPIQRLLTEALWTANY